MPIIPTIEEQAGRATEVQISRRGGAEPEDFGYQIGSGMKELGRGTSEAADRLDEHAVSMDVTQVHANMAKAAVDLDQQMVNDASQAKPGEDFVGNTLAKTSKYFSEGAASAATPQGGKLWAVMSSQMTEQLGKKAVALQADIYGKAAVNDYNKMLDSYGQLVSKNPGAYDEAKAAIGGALYGANSSYSHTSAAWRDEQMRAATINLAFLANKANAKINGNAYLTPEFRAAFKTPENYIKNYAVPGAKVDITPETMAKADEVAPVAAASGVHPGVALAVIDQNKTEPQAPKELVGDLSKLVVRFGGDYSKVLGAYYLGTQKVEQAMNIHGTGWQESLPSAAQSFIQNTMTKGGMVPTNDTPAMVMAQPQADIAPAEAPKLPGGPDKPGWDDLPGAMQQEVAQVAMQTKMQELQMKETAIRIQHLEKADAADKSLTGAVNSIIQGKFTNADMVKLSDPTAHPELTHTDRQNIASWFLSYTNARRANAENQSNPGLDNKLFARVIEAASNPNVDPQAVKQEIFAAVGRTSSASVMRLLGELQSTQTSSVYAHQLNNVTSAANRAFSGNFMRSIAPELIENAKATFSAHVSETVDQWRQAGKDIKPLFTPGSSDYLAKPEILQKWVTDGFTAMGAKAEAIKKNLPDYDHAQPGQPYLGKDGSVKEKGTTSAEAKAKPAAPRFETDFSQTGGALPNPLDNLHLPSGTAPDLTKAQQKFGERR